MQIIQYHNNELMLEQVSLQDIIHQYGTPCFAYSATYLENTWHTFNTAFGKHPHQICYAVKANSNLAILHLFAGFKSGFDVVSVGELERVLAAGGSPSKIVFSGVCKKTYEIERALEVGIQCFNVESINELEQLNQIAKSKNRIAPISLRINPNIDARTHPYIATGLLENKFGIDHQILIKVLKNLKSFPNLKLIGLGFHIGSQITELSPFAEAIELLATLINELHLPYLQHINVGGGLGVNYQNESPPSIQDYVSTICEKLGKFNLEILIEPGRSLVANSGVMLTTIEFLKQSEHKHFAIVDAGMNDFMRPALYQAWHDILPVTQRTNLTTRLYDVVGPVCETADFLGKDRDLAIQEKDALAVLGAGAYGFSMSSNYNSRPRAAEVMVRGNKSFLIRERETIQQLFALEKIIPEKSEGNL